MDVRDAAYLQHYRKRARLCRVQTPSQTIPHAPQRARKVYRESLRDHEIEDA